MCVGNIGLCSNVAWLSRHLEQFLFNPSFNFGDYLQGICQRFTKVHHIFLVNTHHSDGVAQDRMD